MVELATQSLHGKESTPPPPSGELPSRVKKIDFHKEGTKVWQKRDEIVRLVQDPNVPTIFLDAATGTGKTFAGSQIILDALPPGSKMVMTENLRYATKKSAIDIASDRKQEVGDEVGFSNRYERATSDKTRLLFCPMQSLLNMVERDPTHLLEKYDLIMVDEVHKESKQNELLLATLKDIQNQRAKTDRPLKLVLTSATMDKEKLGKYFPGAKEVVVQGDNITVDPIFHKEKVPMEYLPEEAAKKVEWSIKEAKDQGNILVFLSGKPQIDEAKKALEAMNLGDDIEIHPYLGSMPKEERDIITKKIEEGKKRMIFLATNAAQESLTWPIKVVVDSCTQKQVNFDPVTGKSYLTEVPAPLDHLTQRKGRVGRRAPQPGEAPDKYYPLTTKFDWEGRQKFETPEIQRTDLTSEVLTMLASGYNPYSFDYINRPETSHIDSAYKRLERIGALKGKKLTEKGRFMASLQLSANNASLVADGIKYGVLEDASRMAAMLEVYSGFDPFEGNETLRKEMRGETRSDLIPYMKLLDRYGKMNKSEQESWATSQGLRVDRLNDALKLSEELIKEGGKIPPQLDVVGKTGGFGLDLAIHDSFADTPIVGNKKNFLTVEGVGGPDRVSIDKRSALSGDHTPPEFICANIRVIAKNGIIEGRSATLNHEFTTAAAGVLYGLEHPSSAESAKPKAEEDRSQKTEDKKEETTQVDVNAEVPQLIEDEKKPEEAPKPPEKPLPFYKRWWNGFRSWLSRLFS
jgi:HrpA-like RNA helicase